MTGSRSLSDAPEPVSKRQARLPFVGRPSSPAEPASAYSALSELDPVAKLRVQIAGLSAALAVALMVLFGGHLLRQPLYDLFQTVAPGPDVSRRVHVVVIDADSLRDVGGWPWTRFYLARLVEQISDRGAAVIGFDMLFPEPDRLAPSEFTSIYNELPTAVSQEIQSLPSMDAVFARVIGRSPVVLARAGVAEESFDRLDGAPPPLPPEAKFVGAAPEHTLTFPSVVANIPILDGAPLGHGLVNGERDSDGLVRRVPLFAEAAGQVTPGFAVELVRVAEGWASSSCWATRGGWRPSRSGPTGSPRVPTDNCCCASGTGGRPRPPRPWTCCGRARGRTSSRTRSSSSAWLAPAPRTSPARRAPRRSTGSTSRPRRWTPSCAARGSAGPAGRRRWNGNRVRAGDDLVPGVPRAPMGPVLVAAAVELALAFGASWIAFQNNLLLDPYPMLAPGAANSAVMVALLFVEGRRVQARLRGALEDERLSAARISGELAAASEIQSGMLLPRAELDRISPAVEIDAVVQSAKTVGGDLYDAFLFDDGRVCFLVGDVTGKGVPASLFMALSKALSRSLLMRPETSLEAAVREINAELSRDNRQAMAVSLLVGVLHPGDGRLDLCCAGHENPLVVGADGTVRELKLDGGPPLCVDETFPYPQETDRLAPGEVLVAFTDGLTEAQDPTGALFSRQQVFDALSQASRAPTLAGMVDAVVNRVRAFEAGGEPSDDLTVMAVRLRSSGG